MAMKQINSKIEEEEEERRKKKGKIGEVRVAKALRKRGFRVGNVADKSEYINGGQYRYNEFDLLVFGYGHTFWAQVKNKEPRTYCPDTGLEQEKFEELCKSVKDSGSRILLLFTDDSKKIYGDWVSKLFENEIGYTGWNAPDKCLMIYFLLDNLKDLDELLDELTGKHKSPKQLPLKNRVYSSPKQLNLPSFDHEDYQ